VKNFLLLLSFVITATDHAQTKIDTAALKAQLNAIAIRDQRPRTTGDSAEFISFIDSSNLAQVEAIIQHYGWPGKSLVGAEGNMIVWMVIQHSELQTQEKYFPLMKKSVDQKESRACDLAYLEDRILMYKGKKQLYGSQIMINQKTGAQEIWPVEDEKNLNARRAQVGLESMEEYAAHFGIDYKVPEQ
jgi:hypothetical protein